jgi:hypothetical protein
MGCDAAIAVGFWKQTNDSARAVARRPASAAPIVAERWMATSCSALVVARKREMRDMTSSRSILILVVCALAFGLIAPAALAQAAGSIEGQVVHAEEGPLGGLFVQLDHFDNMTLVDSVTTQTDDEGRFEFDDLEPGSDQIYIARVIYDEVEYSSGMVVVTDEALSQSITLTVAGTTEDDDFIALERVHLIVQPLADAVQVGEMLIISNYGDAAYSGSPLPDGTMATIRITLPTDAAQVAFESGELGERFIEIAGGVADTQSVAPGRSVDQIVLSYNLPPRDDSWTLEYEFSYPVNALNVLLMNAGWQLESDALTFEGLMGSDTNNFLNYSGGDLAAGETLSLRFTPGEPDMSVAAGTETSSAMPTPVESVQDTLLWIAIALGAVLLVAVVSYPVWRRGA